MHIDLRGASIQRDTTATLTLDSVAADAGTIVPVGTLVGQLELQLPRVVRALVSNR